jgi:hypothetical protein
MPPVGGRGKKQASPLREGDRGSFRPSGLISSSEVVRDASHEQTDGDELGGRSFARTRPRLHRSKSFERTGSNGHHLASKRAKARLFGGCRAGSEEDLVWAARLGGGARNHGNAQVDRRHPSSRARGPTFRTSAGHHQRWFGLALRRHMWGWWMRYTVTSNNRPRADPARAQAPLLDEIGLIVRQQRRSGDLRFGQWRTGCATPMSIRCSANCRARLCKRILLPGARAAVRAS